MLVVLTHPNHHGEVVRPATAATAEVDPSVLRDARDGAERLPDSVLLDDVAGVRAKRAQPARGHQHVPGLEPCAHLGAGVRGELRRFGDADFRLDVVEYLRKRSIGRGTL